MNKSDTIEMFLHSLVDELVEVQSDKGNIYLGSKLVPHFFFVSVFVYCCKYYCYLFWNFLLLIKGELHLPYGQKKDVFERYREKAATNEPNFPKVGETLFYRVWRERLPHLKVRAFHRFAFYMCH
jgi:hypothetical protein